MTHPCGNLALSVGSISRKAATACRLARVAGPCLSFARIGKTSATAASPARISVAKVRKALARAGEAVATYDSTKTLIRTISAVWAGISSTLARLGSFITLRPDGCFPISNEGPNTHHGAIRICLPMVTGGNFTIGAGGERFCRDRER